MKSLRKDFLSLAKIIALGVLVGLASSYAFAWVEPPQNPPNENAPAPINVSDSAQTKQTGLTLNSGNAQGLVASTGLLVPYGNVKFNLPSNKLLFVGLASEVISTTNHNLRVYGNVNADYYCDRDGANCTAAGDLGNGGGGGTGDGDLTVKEADGSPTVTAVDTISLDAGLALTDSGNGDVEVDVNARYSLAIVSNFIQLLNDNQTPGNNKCYGTGDDGKKGWYVCDIDGNAGGDPGTGGSGSEFLGEYARGVASVPGVKVAQPVSVSTQSGSSSAFLTFQNTTYIDGALGSGCRISGLCYQYRGVKCNDTVTPPWKPVGCWAEGSSDYVNIGGGDDSAKYAPSIRSESNGCSINAKGALNPFQPFALEEITPPAKITIACMR